MNLSRGGFLVGLLALCGAAHAWNASGHMVIAAIAERNLNGTARAEAERLLKFGATTRANDFITAGPWADDVRPDRQETAPWHYINLHFRLDGKPVTMKPDPENVITAIAKLSAVLHDRSKPDIERADALRFLIHFVGDVHQPLHATALDTDERPQGDRGGNLFRIQPPFPFNEEERPPTNLHALWDRGVGLFPEINRPLSPSDRKLVLTQAATLIAAIPRSSSPRAADMNPAAWAEEGRDLARSAVYRVSLNGTPSQAYIVAGQALCAKQAAIAGYRLAWLLNTLLTSKQ